MSGAGPFTTHPPKLVDTEGVTPGPSPAGPAPSALCSLQSCCAVSMPWPLPQAPWCPLQEEPRWPRGLL